MLAPPRTSINRSRGAYPGSIELVLGEVTTARYSEAPAHDWRALATDGVRVLVLPGEDNDMLKEPLVDELAAHLNELLSTVP